jgi:hypothetical protein
VTGRWANRWAKRAVGCAGVLALSVIAVVGCGSEAPRTDTVGTGGATTSTLGPIHFPIVARLDPSCRPEIEDFGPALSGPAADPPKALIHFTIAYDHQSLVPALMYQAIAPTAAGVASTSATTSSEAEALPPGQRVWAVHLDDRRRVVLVIHIVHGPHGWYVHELQRCAAETSTTG